MLSSPEFSKASTSTTTSEEMIFQEVDNVQLSNENYERRSKNSISSFSFSKIFFVLFFSSLLIFTNGVPIRASNSDLTMASSDLYISKEIPSARRETQALRRILR